jgi:hypothetical protein
LNHWKYLLALHGARGPSAVEDPVVSLWHAVIATASRSMGRSLRTNQPLFTKFWPSATVAPTGALGDA